MTTRKAMPATTTLRTKPAVAPVATSRTKSVTAPTAAIPRAKAAVASTAAAFRAKPAATLRTKSPAAPVRCRWTLDGNDLYLQYHDTEWGVPAWDDATQFEFLILEGAQAGLSWATILNKREGYREAFEGFDPERMARFGKRETAKLMNNPNIVRNRLKIAAAIGNARAYLEFQGRRGAFARHLWSFVGGKPLQNDIRLHERVPATSPESDALAKDLKQRGFRFVGSTIVYAHMQATGMVNDHLTSCYRHRECKALGQRPHGTQASRSG